MVFSKGTEIACDFNGEQEEPQISGHMRMRKLVATTFLGLGSFFALATQPSFADPYVIGTDLSNFTIYGFGSGFTDQLQPGALTVNGNVGMGPGGDMTLGGSGVTISGQIFDSNATVSNITFSGGPNSLSVNGTTYANGVTPSQVAAGGGIVVNSSVATNAKTDELALYNT